jgi:hypothetical protein|tara:strand:+ start:732 stop:1076 length:345 start_codon:yes stop_codon:yes gene_type:complete
MFFKLNSNFKINAPFQKEGTPIYSTDLEEGVLGKANNNGTILVSDKITDPEERRSVIEHEKIHIDQMKRGDLDYDDENVYWKGKKYSRDEMKEGAEDLPWEAEAYAKTDPFEKY